MRSLPTMPASLFCGGQGWALGLVRNNIARSFSENRSGRALLVRMEGTAAPPLQQLGLCFFFWFSRLIFDQPYSVRVHTVNTPTKHTRRRRHRQHVEACLLALRAAQTPQMPLDLAAEELRIASSELGRITGAVGVEELLDVIFRDFCIGK